MFEEVFPVHGSSRHFMGLAYASIRIRITLDLWGGVVLGMGLSWGPNLPTTINLRFNML